MICVNYDDLLRQTVDTSDVPFLPQIECVLDLPFPTSTNQLWAKARRRLIPSRRYEAWKAHADVAVLANGTWRKRLAMPGHFTAFVLLDSAHRLNRMGKGRDADNHIKAPLDWAERMEIVTDDALCDEVTARWVPTCEAPAGCRLILKPLEAPCATA